MTSATVASAKVNLYLHVGAPDASGYHALSSLVVFADVGDRLTLEPAMRFSLVVEGPWASALTAADDNLVVRAVQALAEAAGDPMPAVRLILDKQLPVAGGLGGGSSDAAAALRLVRDHAFPHLGDETLLTVLARLGADGPMCLAGRPVTAEGRGERLSPSPSLPPLHAVLANPGVECPTARVYAAYDEAGRFGGAERGDLRCVYDSVGDLASDLAGCRNDLEPPAVAGRPAVGEVLAALRAAPESLLARLSGSGATAFALCADPAAASELAGRLAREHPGWWIKSCRLGGPWF